jgi:hypothetical protein
MSVATASLTAGTTYHGSLKLVSSGEPDGLYFYKFTVTAPTPTDATPPNIGYTLMPANPDGNNGWYKSNVTLTWAVTENDSPSSVVKNGCVDQNITTDQLATTYSCSATSDGGAAATVSVTIKRDGTPPSVAYTSASPSTPNGSNGWYTSDVTATFTATDNFSGFGTPAGATTTGTNATSSEGSNVTVGSPAFTDNAGNTAAVGTATSASFNIDKTAPTASAGVSPAANGNGWNNADATVTFTGNDAGSGIANCSAPVTVNTETSGQTVSGTCTDNAGLTSTQASVTVRVDKTDPTISGAPTTSPNGAGWYRADVVVAWTCGDALSGIDGTCPSNSTITGEGSSLSAGASVNDKAGNSASATVSGIKIDRTAPTVGVTGVTNGATYVLGSVPSAGCSTSDALSGVATIASLSTSGGPVGSVTVTCSGATDVAGNGAAAIAATFSVIYNWAGFFQPVDNGNVLNSVKAGSAIPVKFSLGGDQGLNIFATGFPSSLKIACASGAIVDDIETTVTAGNSSLTYDALAGQYVYIWKTDKTWTGTCRQLQVKLVDGTIHTANFQFK